MWTRGCLRVSNGNNLPRQQSRVVFNNFILGLNHVGPNTNEPIGEKFGVDCVFEAKENSFSLVYS